MSERICSLCSRSIIDNPTQRWITIPASEERPGLIFDFITPDKRAGQLRYTKTVEFCSLSCMATYIGNSGTNALDREED